MSDRAAISVINVSKAFKLPHEKQSSIKGLFVNIFRGKRTFERQEVLHDISFEVKKGEFFGVVGRNGSGKSTLLKLLAGIYSPNKGAIHINGKLTPFIELGVGFNPELTGRENVFLNGALLGFNRKEMMAMYDDIVAFAEIERFMDQKLKNYSSGMQVRLAFSIAIRTKSDILLVDEVLAVGDLSFQKKCFKVFEQLKKEGRTIVFISHDMNAITRFCDRAALIDGGKIHIIGPPREVATVYMKQNAAREEAGSKEKLSIKGDVNIEALKVLKSDPKHFKMKDTIKVSITLKALGDQRVVAGMNFIREDGFMVIGFNSYTQVGPAAIKAGETQLYEFEFAAKQLTQGFYTIDGVVYDTNNDYNPIFYKATMDSFTIIERDNARWGMFNIEGTWKQEKHERKIKAKA